MMNLQSAYRYIFTHHRTDNTEKAHEQQLVLLFLLLSFFYGATTVFAYTASISLFLAKFPTRLLPFIYLTAAGLMVGSGYVFTFLEAKLPRRVFFVGAYSSLAVTAVLFQVGAAADMEQWLFFALLVWFRLLYALTRFTFWALANTTFNIQQAKRLFGVIGTGEMIALALGYTFISLIVEGIGAVNLLLLAAFTLSVCALLVGAIVQIGSEKRPQTIRYAVHPPGLKISTIRQDSYLMAMLMAGFLVFIVYFLVDFSFFSEVQLRYQDVDALAKFVGRFYTAVYALGVIFRAGLTRPLLHRFGIRSGLYLLPATTLVLGACLFIGSFYPTTMALFVLVTLFKLLVELLQRAFYHPAFLLLYQPLPKPIRLSFQSVIDNMVMPIGIGVAGLLLILLNQLSFNPLKIIAALIGSAGAVWLWSCRTVFLGYKAQLMKSINKRLIEGRSYRLDDGTTLKIIREKLKSERPEEVIYVSQLLEKAGKADIIQTHLPDLLTHCSPAVRIYALQTLAMSKKDPNLFWGIFETEQDSSVQSRAIEYFGAFLPIERLAHLRPFLQSSNAPIRQGAFLGLFQNDDVPLDEKHVQLDALVNSHDVADRLLAARLLGKISVEDCTARQIKLLTDPDPRVQKEALIAARDFGNPKLIPYLLNALRQEGMRETAVSTLTAYGEEALPFLDEALKDQNRQDVFNTVLLILGKISSPKANRFVKSYLSEWPLNYRVLETLSRCNYHADDVSERDHLLAILDRAIRSCAKQQHRINFVAGHPQAEAFVITLKSEYESQLDQIFYLLSFIYDSNVIISAKNQLKTSSSEQRAFALEALEVLLPERIKAKISFILRPSSSMQKSDRSIDDETLAKVALDTLKESKSKWITMAACYTLGQINWRSAAPVIQGYKDADDPMLVETAYWTLARLSQNGNKLQGTKYDMLLTVEKMIILKTVDTFSQIPNQYLAEIAERMSQVHLNAGETLFEKGDEGNSMFIIVSGEVGAYDEERLLNQLGERAVFGEMAILDPAPRAATITALSDTLLLQLHEDDLHELMQEQFEVTRGIIRVLTRFVRQRIDDISELTKQLESR